MEERQSLELRLVELAGDVKNLGLSLTAEMKVLATQVNSLIKLIEKDVADLRKDHEHLKANHKALDDATAASIELLKTDMAGIKAEINHRNRFWVTIGGVVAAGAAAVSTLLAGLMNGAWVHVAK